MPRKYIAQELAVEHRYITPLDRYLYQPLVLRPLEDLGISEQLIADDDGLEEAGFSPSKNHIRVIHGQHGRIVCKAEDESSVNQSTVISRHLLCCLESNSSEPLPHVLR